MAMPEVARPPFDCITASGTVMPIVLKALGQQGQVAFHYRDGRSC